jgi:hypothetical protein
LLHFVKWLALLLPAAVPVLPFAALARVGSQARELAALALGFTAIAGLYVFYEVSHEVWWCLRFILPAVPALLVAAVWGIEVLARRAAEIRARRIRAAAALALACWAIGLSWYWTPRLSVLWMKSYEEAYEAGSLAARDRLPQNAVVLSFAFSGSLFFYTSFPVMRWDQIDPPGFGRYAELAGKNGRPVCAVLFESEENEAFRKCPGPWSKLATIGNVGLWQLDVPKA